MQGFPKLYQQKCYHNDLFSRITVEIKQKISITSGFRFFFLTILIFYYDIFKLDNAQEIQIYVNIMMSSHITKNCDISCLPIQLANSPFFHNPLNNFPLAPLRESLKLTQCMYQSIRAQCLTISHLIRVVPIIILIDRIKSLRNKRAKSLVSYCAQF